MTEDYKAEEGRALSDLNPCGRGESDDEGRAECGDGFDEDDRDGDPGGATTIHRGLPFLVAAHTSGRQAAVSALASIGA